MFRLTGEGLKFLFVCASVSLPIRETEGVGVGCPRNWHMPLTLPPVLGIHMVSDRPEKLRGGKKARHRGGMAGSQLVFPLALISSLRSACYTLHSNTFQFKTDPG